MGISSNIRVKSQQGFDFYETPEEATRLLLRKLIDDGVLNPTQNKIYECCSGAGAIVKVLEEFGFSVKASDIQEEDYVVGKKGIDVYALPDNCCNNILTNPPYNRMTKDDMLLQFLRIARKRVILFLELSYLTSIRRREYLQKSGLKYVYVHSKRVTTIPYGSDIKTSGTKSYAWFVFYRGYSGEPVIRWL